MPFTIKLRYVRGVYNACRLELHVRIDRFLGLRLMVCAHIIIFLINRYKHYDKQHNTKSLIYCFIFYGGLFREYKSQRKKQLSDTGWAGLTNPLNVWRYKSVLFVHYISHYKSLRQIWVNPSGDLDIDLVRIKEEF